MIVPRRVVLAIPLLVVLTSLFFLVRYTYLSLNSNKMVAEIKHGVCAVDIKPGHLYGLKGDVEFYWNKLYTPDDFKNRQLRPDSYLNIPGIWNGVKIGKQKATGKGYATLRFWLDLPERKGYGLKIGELDCSYKLWINGVLRVECGQVGKTKKSSVPSWKRHEAYFCSVCQPTEVVIQISNYEHWKGGAEDMMLLAYSQDILDHTKKATAVSFFILGVFLFLSISHLVIFMYMKNDRSPLMFSLFSLLITLRLVTTGEKIIYGLFPHISWILCVRIEYLSYILPVPVFLHLISLIYPTLFSRRVIRCCWAIGCVASAFVLVLPSTIFTYLPFAYQLVIFFFGAYTLVKITVALLRRYEHSLVIFLGYTFFFFILINDIFYYSKLIDTTFLMPIGVFVMAIAQAFVLSKKNSKAFKDVEMLRDRLELYNRELEDRIEERTQEIYQQKKEIEKQAQELLEANRQLRKVGKLQNALTGMVVHDLKNPLNRVLHFSNNPQVVSAGHQMLSLVQNILDVQKYENSKMELNRHYWTIDAILGRAISNVSYLAAEKSLTINSRIDVKERMLVDAETVERVFTNLLLNAIKYSPLNSNIDLTSDTVDRKVTFVIADHGPGISEDKGDAIFDKFGGFNEKSLGRIKPTGLGLAFCKMVVEAHGGRIGYHSIAGEGTQMWFSLPRTGRLDADVVLSDSSTENEAIEKERPSVLELTFEEIATLSVCVRELLLLAVHEATKIRRTLDELLPKGGDAVEEWRRELLQSVWTGNEMRYMKLLNRILKSGEGNV